VVTFTPGAYAELCRRVALSERADPYVSVCWVTSVVDLVRSPEGNAVWKEVSPARWRVFVQGFPEECETEDAQQSIEDHRNWVEEHLVKVEALRVYFSPQGSGATDVTVDFADGQFRVDQRAV
jgi:hypothetical protein